MMKNQNLQKKITKEPDITQKEPGIKKQKRKRWNACLDQKFIDIVLKLGGYQAATPKRILVHMKEDGITLLEIKGHLQTFRRKAKKDDNYVNKKEKSTAADTKDLTPQKDKYFKEILEEEESYKRQTMKKIKVDKIIKPTDQNDTNMKKQENKKRKIPDNAKSHQSKESKKQEKWSACLDREFIDIVVKLGGAQAATPKKILHHMKEDDITLFEIKNNLQKTKTVDNFVDTKQQPTFVDTQDWTQQMLYYFKERWEKEETCKTQTTDHIAGPKICNVISHKCKASKKQKYTTWSEEMVKKFIDIVFKLGGSQDATPYRIIQHMKDDNVTVAEVQNHLKVSWEKLHGSENSTFAAYKGISKVYMDIGDQIQTCHACKAKLWT
ncbi:DNA helicase PIF1-like protein [Tanacetum coccineum]